MEYIITIKARTGQIVSELVKADSERQAINFCLDMVAGRFDLAIKDLEVINIETLCQ